jgi:hypothetical protein
VAVAATVSEAAGAGLDQLRAVAVAVGGTPGAVTEKSATATRPEFTPWTVSDQLPGWAAAGRLRLKWAVPSPVVVWGAPGMVAPVGSVSQTESVSRRPYSLTRTSSGSPGPRLVGAMWSWPAGGGLVGEAAGEGGAWGGGAVGVAVGGGGLGGVVGGVVASAGGRAVGVAVGGGGVGVADGWGVAVGGDAGGGVAVGVGDAAPVD